MHLNIYSSLFRYDNYVIPDLNAAKTLAVISNGRVNPFSPEISSITFLTICHTILMTLVGRIWYWINQKSPNCYSSLLSSLVCFILNWHCKEKFPLDHSWELKGKRKQWFLCYHVEAIGWGFWRYDITTADTDNLETKLNIGIHLMSSYLIIWVFLLLLQWWFPKMYLNNSQYMYISKATIDQQGTSMFTEPQLNMRGGRIHDTEDS